MKLVSLQDVGQDGQMPVVIFTIVTVISKLYQLASQTAANARLLAQED
jgi:hypothetical protein